MQCDMMAVPIIIQFLADYSKDKLHKAKVGTKVCHQPSKNAQRRSKFCKVEKSGHTGRVACGRRRRNERMNKRKKRL